MSRQVKNPEILKAHNTKIQSLFRFSNCKHQSNTGHHGLGVALQMIDSWEIVG